MRSLPLRTRSLGRAAYAIQVERHGPKAKVKSQFRIGLCPQRSVIPSSCSCSERSRLRFLGLSERFVGEVLCKESNPELAQFLWPSGRAYMHIFFMKIMSVEIPFEKVRREVGYKTNFIPKRFQTVIPRNGRSPELVMRALAI